MKKLFALVIVAAFFVAGCAHNPSQIVSTTQTIIGIDISQSAESSTPHVRFGFVRNQFHRVPTSTNGAIYAPSVNSSIDLKQRLASTDVAEDFQTGDATKTPPTNSLAVIARSKAPK